MIQLAALLSTQVVLRTTTRLSVTSPVYHHHSNFEPYGVAVFDENLGRELHCQTKCHDELSDEQGLILHRNEVDKALELYWGPKSTVKELPFRIDFTSANAQLRKRQSKSELVCKAFGNSRRIVDLTAGLGRDSFILAAAGFDVLLVERNPVLFYLLQDALLRLRVVDEQLGARLRLVQGDAADIVDINDLLAKYHDPGSIIDPTTVGVYLDPMYESNQVGKKASVKKETTMLHRLVRNRSSIDQQGDEYTDNNRGLFATAQRIFGSRIVVKRPLKAGALLDLKPHAQITGSTHRFDIYLKTQIIK